MSRFKYDFVFLRSAGLDGESHGGFKWPTKVGEVVAAPDWNPDPVCGGGLHGLADGLGDWGLMADPASTDTLWYVCGAKRKEAVPIDGDKIKVPKCIILLVGGLAGAMEMIAPHLSTAVQELVASRQESMEQDATNEEDEGAASATGDSGAASATGDRGAASATGRSGAASATGEYGVALAAGWRSRGMVTESCLLVLVERDDDDKIIHHFAAICGESGVEAGVWYTLRDGALVALS